MAQKGLLPYTYEAEESKAGLTVLGGLPLYLDLLYALRLPEAIEDHLQEMDGEQGWTSRQIVVSLILLNVAGGDCVEDIEKLEGDEGFCRIFRKVESQGLTRKERRAQEKRWRQGRQRTFPSSSAIFRWLGKFHDPDQDKQRQQGRAFIPEANEYLRGLGLINRLLLGSVRVKQGEETATLDMDATVAATLKASALYSYLKEKAYQPLTTYWAERGLILHTEFRDGNVPAGYEQMRVLEEALKNLPEGIKKVRLRSDTAGYQHELLRYCAERKNERFGRIEFAIGCDVTVEFRKAVGEVAEEDWKPLYREVQGRKEETGKQWAAVCFVPNAISKSRKDPEYRYLATREELKQPELPGMDKNNEDYPFPVMHLQQSKYKIFGIVTNMDWDGGELIPWLYQRCGKSEEAHGAMKSDFAGGRFPSGDFGENAAWWGIAALAYNLNALMKRLALGGSWVNKRMKAIRFGIIHIAAKVMDHARQLIVRLSARHPSWELLAEARRRIALIAASPG
ncbi:MAG: IS1380 family transposase [Nitrospirales bacterium]|nr:IS1380 family transposase [Nitrospirales bacterium]